MRHPRRRAPQQLLLPVPHTWGGRRRGAGRPPGPRPIVLHRTRPPHQARHPVHVTLRARREVGSLRRPRAFGALRQALRLASSEAFRLVHFSVQRDHVHLLVEASSREALIRGVQGLAVRVARAVNGVLRRRGRVLADRYHARALRTPREVRHALVYVLRNIRKHMPTFRGVDPCASETPTARSLVTSPGTWLLRVGWTRYGPLRADEAPRAPTRTRAGRDGKSKT